MVEKVISKVDINLAFANQNVTGQQRYAFEIMRALKMRAQVGDVDLAFLSIRPGSKATYEWLQALALGVKQRRNSWLLTMTSRGPLVARNHAVVLHDLFVLDHPEWYSRIFHLTHSVSLKLQLKTARLVVCVSEPVAKQLRLRKLTKAEIIVAPNAPASIFVDYVDDELHVAEVLAKFNLEKSSYFFTIGSNDLRKNFASLVSAHEMLSDEERRKTPLVVAGGEYKVFRTSANLERPHVRFLGRITDEDLAVLYANSCAVVFASLDEGFGLPAVEALAVGASLIVNDIEIFRWVCQDQAEFVDCSSPLKISEKLREFSNTLVDRTTDSRKIPRFTWYESATRILDAISTLENSKK